MNGLGSMHGGCMMTFADFALFSLSRRVRGGVPGVTVNLSGDFLGPGHVGDRIEATGEVTRAGASLTFVRGLATAEGRPMLSFSGVIKAVKRRV
jgi:acyl-coenzyme A thioesterase PaaI-like protein